MTSPRKWLRIAGLPLMCVAMFSIAGGHWAVLQTVAWAQMLHSYSKTTSVTEAVCMTFDGKHPCALCCKVNEGRQSEDKAPATVKVDKKSEVFVASERDVVQQPPAGKFSYPRLADPAFSARSDAPPRPVPRVLVS